LNENSKDIMFVECKWQTLPADNTRRIFEDLKEKSKYVRWNNEERNEYFAVVARKIESKSKLKDEGMIVFDLDDISE
jgi:AAA+ ATPase superfamily predicted ATPase